MSLNVPLEELAAVAAEYGSTAYVTCGAGGASPRITHVTPTFTDGVITVVLGGGASRAALENPQVSLLWPATMDQSMSLIVDGCAEVDGEPGPDTTVVIAPTSAVRHRPAPPA